MSAVAVAAASARRLWTLYEPIHALTYFAPECHQAFEAAGLRGFWRGYFAGRAAPMGAVEAGPVTAIFFGFHSDFVARAIPEVWSLCAPEQALRARLAGVDAGMRAALGDFVEAAGVVRAAEILREACAAVSGDRRPLFAANASLEWPQAPHLALWHAATVLREHRGDGHVMALVAAELDPCEAHVLRLACTGASPESIQPYRGWSESDWVAAIDRLAERGLIDPSGVATTAGGATHDAVELQTDRLAAVPTAAIGDRLVELTEILVPIARRLDETGVIPYPNPIGVPPVTT